MERQILHLRVISFPVAVYQVKDPSLRGRPVIVSTGRGSRGVVLSASPEAAAEGVRSGMTLAEVHRWCRRILILPPDLVLFERAEKALAEVLQRFSPVVEPRRGGSLYVDLTGMRRLLGGPVDIARRIQKEIERGLGLGPNAGLGVNKLISGVATRIRRPISLLDVLPGQEEGFLSPLAIRHLPAVNPETEGRLLEDLNIRKVKELRAIDLPHLNLAFGVKGPALYRQARGIDDSPVRPPERALTVEEDETLPEDTNDDAALLGCLYTMLERCGARLRALGLPAGEVRLSARFSDGIAVTRGITISPPSARDLTLYSHVRPLFEKIVERRGRVRYLRIRFAKLTRAPAQMPLFEPPVPGREELREPDLLEALDRIRKRFGARSIAFGRTAASPGPGNPGKVPDAA